MSPDSGGTDSLLEDETRFLRKRMLTLVGEVEMRAADATSRASPLLEHRA